MYSCVYICVEAGVQWASAQPGLIPWSRDVPLLLPSHSPPHPSYYRLSPLAALQRDRPGWYTPRRFSSSQICDSGYGIMLINTIKSLQSHCIHTQSHWSSGPPICFSSWETWVQSPGGYLCDTGILLLALSHYNNAIYFPFSITSLWYIPQIFCPLSIDCYYLLGWLTNSGIKGSMCVHHIFLTVIANSWYHIKWKVLVWKDFDFTWAVFLYCN